ncbi:MAG: amidohydrolase family protein, partial [Gammaproteobacteria bacterium]|nr:amidohydrolase family protein [Gammaproteobacteria bacterium]
MLHRVSGLTLVAVVFLGSAMPLAQPYDLAILNGRVVDPETGLDAVKNVGIANGRIEVVTDGAIHGAKVIDATGLVVAPGFIDLHSHGALSEANQAFQLRDGVTTTLELEAGVRELPEVARGAARLINFGASAGYLNARMETLDGLTSRHLSDTEGS